MAHGLSRCGAGSRTYRLRSCSARAQLPCGLWDLGSQPGIEPVSPSGPLDHQGGPHTMACFFLPLLSCQVVSDSFATPWTIAGQVPLSGIF